MITFNEYIKRRFGEKLYKLSLDAGLSCPNRDGTLGRGGCIFCSAGGSGDFAASRALPVEEQIEEAKARVKGKFNGEGYIAYFQAYTNTYAPVEKLESIYLPVIRREDIRAISIATRPDCLGEDVMALLERLNQIKPVFVELGLQTIHEKSARYIRRGYATEVYDQAVLRLKEAGIHVVTHVILGLPGESEEEMLETVRHVRDIGSDGIKLQLLHVLEGTDLLKDYEAGKFKTLSFDAYVRLVAACVGEIGDSMVIHRLTGDGPKKILIAPLWSGDKKRVLNAINREIRTSEKKKN